jgi:two-component system CheB/CheR fusion protein
MTTNQTSNEAGAPDPERPLPTSSLDFPVVGIGASAGGIQTLLRLFENMPNDAGMAFVIVLHLSPNHESVADQVLQRATKMRVVQVTTTTRIEKNSVYLISPSNNLSMEDGHLCVTHVDRLPGRPVTIDLFFRSLAEAHGARAISIILSGSGSDGSVGIGRIKEFAGITIAQSPEDAEYDDMPRNAIATGMVDIVLPIADIPQKLIELWANMRAIELPQSGHEQPAALAVIEEHIASPAERALQAILTILHTRTGHDFHHYKRATVLRRIERRLQVNALPSMPLYLKFLDSHPEETAPLLKDMLIGVTNFFRDREAFEAVEREVIPKIVAERTLDNPMRVWVPGCSTGEEVYSLAMLFCERQQEGNELSAIHLFATDIDQHAIEIARAGNYPESILTDVVLSQ